MYKYVKAFILRHQEDLLEYCGDETNDNSRP